MSRMSSTLKPTADPEREREREREKERERDRVNLEWYYVQHVHTINLLFRWQEKKSSTLTSN